MGRNFLAVLLCLIVLSILAVAQNTEPKVVVNGVAGGFVTVTPTEFFVNGHPVKGAPYSAEAFTESVQTLADGNRIVHNSSYKIFRDNEGRTRREMGLGNAATTIMEFDDGGGHLMTRTGSGFGSEILIGDPVAGANYSLNEEKRIARRLPVPQFIDLSKAVAGARAEAKTARTGTATTEPGRVTINASSDNRFSFSVAPGGDVAYKAVLKQDSDNNVVTESLGTQVIEGVEAQGTRTTRTIPAGTIGNELPIVITNETWYSSKLQTTLLSKRHDPRSGDRTFRLTNISQAEPASSLFQVPADYTIVDAQRARETRPRPTSEKRFE